MTFSRHEQTAHEKGYFFEHRFGSLVIIGPKGRPLKLQPGDGYPQFKIRLAGRKLAQVAAHRFVAFVKFGEQIYQPGMLVRHRDDNPANFHPDNLLLGTHSQNMMDKSPEARRRDASHPKHDLKAIREFYEVCGSYGKTMQHFGISSKGTLHSILNRACNIPLKHAA